MTDTITRPLLGKLVFIWDLNHWQPAHVVARRPDVDDLIVVILGHAYTTTAPPCTDLSNPKIFEYITEEKFRELENVTEHSKREVKA